MSEQPDIIQVIADAAALMAAKPRHTFCSCKLFPKERGIGFQDEGGDSYTVAHPDFWKAAIHAVSDPDWRCVPFGGTGYPVISLDVDKDEYVRITQIMLASMERELARK